MAQVAMRRIARGQFGIIEGLLADSTGKGRRKLAGGIHIPKKNICQRWASFESRTPCVKNGGHMGGGPRQHQWTASKNNQDHRFACGDYSFEELFLRSRKAQPSAACRLSLHPVGAFAEI